MRQFLTGLILSCCIAGTNGMAEGTFPYAVTTATLPNGLKVIIIPMESPGLVAYYSVVRTGSRDEVEPGKSGFAHFFEHMMFRGTKTYPAGVYDSIVTSIGASANAYTDDDLTVYHLNFATDDLEKVVDIESDRFQNLQYEESAFQTEAGAIYGEYRKGVTNPFEVLNEKIRDVAFDVHTYKHTTIGFEKDIRAMPEAFGYSISFFKRFYRPDNVVLLLAGDVNPEGAMTLIRRYYGGWAKGYAPSKVLPEPPQTAERGASVAYQGKTLPILDVAYKGEAFDPNSKDFVAAQIFGELAFGNTSDLYKKLYLREQRVDALQPSIPAQRDMPLFEILVRAKKEEDLDALRDEIYGTIALYQSTAVDVRRLADVKKRKKYSFLMNLDTPNKVAGGLAYTIAITGGVEAVDAFYATIDKITPDDIRRAAKKYFIPERRTVVTVKGIR